MLRIEGPYAAATVGTPTRRIRRTAREVTATATERDAMKTQRGTSQEMVDVVVQTVETKVHVVVSVARDVELCAVRVVVVMI